MILLVVKKQMNRREVKNYKIAAIKKEETDHGYR